MNRTIFAGGASGEAAAFSSAASAASGAGAYDSASIGGANDAAAAAPMEPSMVCTCIVTVGPRICFATYNEDTNKIILEESPSGVFEVDAVAERYLALVRPNLLLISSATVSNEGLLEALTKPLPEADVQADGDEEGGGTDSASKGGTSNDGVSQQQKQRRGRGINDAASSSHRSIPFRVQKSGVFDRSKCMALILQKLRVLSLMRRPQNNSRLNSMRGANLHLPPGATSYKVSNYNSIGSLLDFESELQIKAVGGLLNFLEKTIFSYEEGGTITIGDIVHVQSSMYMNIDSMTFSALNIFATEHHPLMVANGRGNSKEGFSLFTLLDRTKSRGGRQMLRNWMLKPLLSRDELMLRQDGVELFMADIDCEAQFGAILNLLSEVGSITQIFSRLKKCCAVPFDFVMLSRTLSAGSKICSILASEVLEERLRPAAAVAQRQQQEQPGKVQDDTANRYIIFLEGILDRCNVPVLDQVNEEICATIHVESTSKARDTICIRDGFHEELDSMKARYNGLSGKLC
jgi:hypothetical protein